MSSNVSALPHPPPYYRLWGANETALEPPNLPSHGDTITVFGIEERCPPVIHSENPNPEEGVLANGAEDRSDLATELHKTTALAMKTYCQLLEVLSKRPGLKPPKEDDLQHLFRAAHSLLNSARDYQAREELIVRLRLQVENEERIYSSLQKAIHMAREDQTISENGILCRVPSYE